MRILLKIISFLLVLNLSALPLFSKDKGIGVFISSQKISFYEDNPVEVILSIQNNSDSDILFPLYNVSYSSFQPIVFDEKGREAEIVVKYRLMNRPLKEVLKNINPRKVVLGPGEILSHKIDLRMLYNLKKGGKYKVRGFFLPDAKKEAIIRSDNVLYITIMPKEMPDDGEDHQRQKMRKISPSEIIRLFLVAEKSEKWYDYLKYVKLEKYINAFSDYSLAFNSASKSGKKMVLKDFVGFLSSPRKDYVLDYNIIKESILGEKGVAYVVVNVKRYGGAYPFVYKYKYSLEKYKDFWLITGVQATVTRELE